MMRRIPPLLALGLLLAGCNDSDVKEVKQWMTETEAQTKPSVTPISPPKTFVPFEYSHKDMMEPTNPTKLMAELAKASSKSNNPFKPDDTRRKELLESFPLDTVKMVGTLEKAGTIYALLQIDRVVYQVKSGQYVGQNYGRIASVSEDTVVINERVQDATGEWVERISKLELQDSKETKK